MSKIIFLLALGLIAGHVAPPFALLGGPICGLAAVHPFPTETNLAARFSLQVSVVAFGSGMKIHDVLQAGRSGLFYTAISITADDLGADTRLRH